MEEKEQLEMTESEKIKYYISIGKKVDESDTMDNSGTIKKNIKTKCTTETPYEVILSSGLDTIINRNYKGKIKSFILMPSQNIYVFKQDDIVQDIQTTTLTDFLLFFNIIPKDGINVNNIIIDILYKKDLPDLYKMIKNMTDELREGLISLPMYQKCYEQSLKINKKIWKMIVTKSAILRNQNKYNKKFIDLVFDFYNNRGYDAALYFVESYTKSSMKNILTGYNNNIIKMKDLDTKRLIDYLCFDLYAQGFEQIPLSIYYSYLSNSILYENKIRNKYPSSLLTTHDIMSLKLDQLKQKNEKEIFEKRIKKIMDDLKNINNDFSKQIDTENNVLFRYKSKTLFLPKESIDLIEEGQSLGHCVGTYIDQIVRGECFIGFIREDFNIEKSYLTVEFRFINENGKINYSIAQVQGDLKRKKLTENEIDFFKAFMKESGFRSTNDNLKDI